MKTAILSLTLLIAALTTGFAQCGKNLVLTSSKTEHLDASGNLKRAVNEIAKIELNQADLLITINNNHKITGTIKSSACDWKVPFKEGKTTLKASITGENGEPKNVTITIEGKNGKVTLLFETQGEPDDTIRVGIDTFAEKS